MIDMKTVNNNINQESNKKTIRIGGNIKKIKNNRNTGIIIKDNILNNKGLMDLKIILAVLITKGMTLRIQDKKNAKDNIQIKLMMEMYKFGRINNKRTMI